MRKEINFKKYTHVEIKLASQTEYKPRVACFSVHEYQSLYTIL